MNETILSHTGSVSVRPDIPEPLMIAAAIRSKKYEQIRQLVTEADHRRLEIARHWNLPYQSAHIMEGFATRLLERFTELTGFAILGRQIEGPLASHGLGNLITVDMKSASRSIPKQPIVFSTVPLRDYPKPLPICVVDLLGEIEPPGSDDSYFQHVEVLEPIMIPGKRPRYFASLNAVQRWRAKPIDPILAARISRGDDRLFLLAHWD